MKVKNFVSINGNFIPNQFIIIDGNKRIFQSYSSIIAIRENGKITLGQHRDYSKTTGKYRNIFLCETKKETQEKIKSGEYVVDYNL